jgi:hypothetical protein
MTVTIWRTCPSCFGSFEQPDDPGRKRVYCSRACQQAAYRARQRTSAGQQRTGRQDWHSGRQEQRRQRAGSERPGADQRQHRRQERQDQQHRQRRPPPGSANGHRPSATVATSWRAPGASSPPCCARPPPPASRTRRLPAGRRPRPCAPSTASSTDEPTVTPRPGQLCVGACDGRIVTPPLAASATEHHRSGRA